MTQIVSSISSLPIYAPSAAYAPTNGADVSAIASAYTAGLATTAYVDSAVSGVEISFDSSITTASSTAGVTAGVNTGILSGKLDASASSDFYSTSNPSGFITGVDLSNYATTSYVDSAVSGVEISFDSSIATASSTAGVTASVNTAILSAYAYESSNSAKLDATAFSTVSGNFLTSQTVTALGDDGMYITSINGSALSGQGGGGTQVVTSTGSAAVFTGGGGYQTAISGINGSAIVAMSASSASRADIASYASEASIAYCDANGRELTSIGTATGGGSVTSPSGTILVMNGNEIEGTNSAAVVSQTSTGFTSVVTSHGTSIGPSGMGVLTYTNLSDSGMNLVFKIAAPYHGDDATVIISGHDHNWNLASASGLIVWGDTSANIPLGTVQLQLSASSNYWIYLMDDQDLSAVKAPGYAVTGIRELAWKSAVDNVTNTVSSNSASWGQGGMDSATVSAIASSYAESAVSSKADSSALSSYALSSDVSAYRVVSSITTATDNFSMDGEVVNRINHTELRALNAIMDLSGRYLTSLPDSAAVSSIASSYAESAVSGKMDSSAIDYTRTGDGTQIYASGTGSSTNQFSAKNDSAGAAIIAGTNARVRLWDSAATANIYASSVGPWNAATNLVTAQSANWGGSALQLSAGPGISLSLVDNVLLISTAAV